MRSDPPLLPDYRGPCIAGLVPALRVRSDPPPWLPAPAAGAAQIVLFVLDGLGWLQLRQRADLAPTLAAMQGGPITSVVPSTTAAALPSITTGSTPADHGLLGYRLAVGGEVLNVLRWTTASGDARESVPPEDLQPLAAFGGVRVPVVTRDGFEGSGFSRAHLAGTAMTGWKEPSEIAVEVGRLLRQGRPLVYAYYDGIDHAAHAEGMAERYESRLRLADELVDRLASDLPAGAALVVTADHGQVEVGDANLELHPAVQRLVALRSGEGRFRWLHARPGREAELLRTAAEAHGDVAWVVGRQEMEDAGWFGGQLSAAARRRLGDVALVARDPVSFLDPANPAEAAMVCRHGSLTPEEMLVPLLACAR